MKKKTLALLLACCLAIGVAAGGTLAWLTAKTDNVVNTFTSSDINVTLQETTGDEYKMIPGYTISKDPKATVVADSEECWLFVKVEKSTNFENYMTYEMADGWTQLTEDKDGNAITDLVYYRKVETAGIGTAYSVLKGDQVTVKGEVTKGMMEAIDGKNADTDAAKAEIAARPTLTFTAYASQLWKTNKPGTGATEEQISAAQFTAAEAWANIG